MKNFTLIGALVVVVVSSLAMGFSPLKKSPLDETLDRGLHKMLLKVKLAK